jgi:hypothetical protein
MTHTFDLCLDPVHFPGVKIIKPYYATVRYTVIWGEVLDVSLEFSDDALLHISGVANIAGEAREAAENNYCNLYEPDNADMVENSGPNREPDWHKKLNTVSTIK